MRTFLNTGSEFHIEKTDPCHLRSRSIYYFSVVSNDAILFTYIHTYIHTDKQTDRQTGRQTDIYTYIP